MSPRHVSHLFLIVFAVLALAGNWACSSKSSPTGPGGGGGGVTKELDSGDFAAGVVFQHTFSTAGSFPYHCIHHGAMTGTVVVSASAPTSLVDVSITSNTVPFPAATVKPGGVVKWTNNTAATHTVTSD
jgi:plastocyanin